MRRYADVVVHRLLAASLGIAALPESARDSQALQRSAGNMNLRHRNAQMAGRASVELHTLIFFKSRAIVTEARVLRVRVLIQCQQTFPCCSSPTPDAFTSLSIAAVTILRVAAAGIFFPLWQVCIAVNFSTHEAWQLNMLHVHSSFLTDQGSLI